MRVWLVLLLLIIARSASAAPGYSVWGDFKYPPGFTHFDYVNPQAPKGGELKLVAGSRISTFDKYNPFTLKGTAPSFLADLLFEGLLTGSMDEIGVGYGLLAEDVEVAADGLSAIFRLRPQARFHNGDRVSAADVKHSYETLISKYAAPAYASVLVDVAGCDVLDDRSVRFRFRKRDRQLPLVVGGLPVFSTKWGVDGGKAKTFDQVVNDIPIATGPYKIGPVRPGKDITYVRDPSYWARDLPVRRGMNNFDRITVKIYRDNTAQLEALKAGEFDLMLFFSAGDWSRRLNGPRIDRGQLVKSPFQHRTPDGFQSYVLNERLPKFQDRRVRMALELAMDYEWMNRQLFYGAYQRVNGLFGNTDCQATGLPGPDEMALLEPWKKDLPAAVFGPAAQSPRTDRDNGLRENLRAARDLLQKAGWEIKDGALRNAKGEPLVIDYLDSNDGGARTVTPWARNLEKLGVQLKHRAVDFALYQQRLSKFEFEITTLNYPGTNSPGQEFADMFGSRAALMDDSGNLSGASNPAIDAIIARMTSATTKADLLPACRALERVITHSHYLIPQWTAGTHRLAFNDRKLARPQQMPPYSPGENWVIYTWWAK